MVQWKKIMFFCFVGIAFFTVGYMGTNHFPIFEPRLMPQFEFEKKIPFMPWTGWIYISDYVLLFIALYLVRHEKNLDKYFYSFMFCAAIHFVVFLFLPTKLPRASFPMNAVNLANAPMHFVRLLDKPHNCFPSLHVGTCFLGAFFFIAGNKKYLTIFTVWATIIALSTLTTKQHYFLDVLGGTATAVLSYWIFLRSKSQGKEIETAI